ncbi:MAG: SPASM domain-containing protein [Candidatus Omnitrophica bacterium]|nr:SPASM domain-containing protein [Candidatus Omnitrophota bacterium]
MLARLNSIGPLKRRLEDGVSLEKCKDMNNQTIDDARAIRLARGIRLRPEYFGGLIFDDHQGCTLEVDKNIFRFLHFLESGPQRIPDVLIYLGHKSSDNDRVIHSFNDALRQLLDLKVIEFVDPSALMAPAMTDQIGHPQFKSPRLSAPETVHWAVTYRCDAHCPDCYAERLSHSRKELNTAEALGLIDKLADWKVFQLAIGGGEPFARQDLPQLVRHADRRGLVVHLTTAKLNTPMDILDQTLPSIRHLQVGIWNEALLNTHCGRYKEQLDNYFLKTQKYQIRHGASVILNKTAVENLIPLVGMLSDIGFERIIFLRYKPPQSIKRWKAEVPEPHQLKGLHHILHRILADNPHLCIRVDCALSFVQRHLSQMVSAECGLKGCVAADRIMAIAADGSVYPCSQLVHDQAYGGNIMEANPGKLWNESRPLRKYRSFRAQKIFKNSCCGQCLAKESCGGCRIFAMDGMGGDPGCPDPVLPPREQLGRTGRWLDLIIRNG